jgi:hypothetical protein
VATDTTERGLERLICTALAGAPCDPGDVSAEAVHERPAAYGAGWICGAPGDYDREYCVDLAQLRAFLRTTRPKVAEALDLENDGPSRRRFLARLQGEVSKRGVIDVLRHGVKDGPHQSTSSMAPPRRATRRRPSAMVRIGSRSRGNCNTAATRPNSRSTWACSSTVYRWRPSS